MKNENLYIKPKVALLHQTPLAVAEIAARTAYDSFDKSEHQYIREYGTYNEDYLNDDIDSSKLLNQLAWVHFHHSVLEHCVLQFHIKDISRGVLQEAMRHRIASPTVRSTRYTLSPLILAYAVSQVSHNESVPRKQLFTDIVKKYIDFSIITEPTLLDAEIHGMYFKFSTIQVNKIIEYGLSKSQIEIINNDKISLTAEKLYNKLINEKSKRNSGDQFKFIVTDNFKTEWIWTINLRALKNFLDLRLPGSAYFQIRWLANAIKNQIPQKYLELVHKEKQ